MTDTPPVQGTRRSEPRCPDCGVTGIEHIVSRESVERSRSRQPWFHVIHCDACGHVYDVLAKHVFAIQPPPRFDLPR
jgi:uncharacterized Zn finger protein